MNKTATLIAAAAIWTLAFPASAWSGEWWTDDTERNAWMVASNASLVADWAQTRQIATDPDFVETNPILGSHPSTAKVDLYFVGVLVLHNIVGYALNDKWAKRYFAGITAIELSVVQDNYQLGIRFGF